MKRQSGFTLVELLVAIGIVATLAALLLSAAGPAFAAFHKTGCIANLRDIGKAVGLYSADNDGYLPPGYVKLDGEGASTWFAGIAPYLETSGAKPSNNKADVRYCPATSVTGADIYKRDRATWRTDYACNARVFVGTTSGNSVNRVKRTAVAGNTILAYDGLQSGTEIKPNAHARHQERINILFVDNHLETVTSMPEDDLFWKPL